MALINNKQTRGVGFQGAGDVIISLVPGWNEVKTEDLEIFKKATKDLKLVKAGLIEYGPTRVEKKDGKDGTVYLDIQDLSEEDAEKIIEGPGGSEDNKNRSNGGTNDIRLLEKWRAKEERPAVRLTLTKRIEYIKDYKAQNDFEHGDADLDND